MSSVKELYDLLSGDAWRVKHAFGAEMLQANALLHNTAATEDEMAECLTLWSQRQQPCQFGRFAASQKRIHFCFLREEALTKWGDSDIAEKIAEERQLWKQRAAFDKERAAHSFIIVVASSRVALATPDQHLRAFSDRILELSGWEPVRKNARRKNTLTSDFLYLRNPTDNNHYGFQYNIDYFACAGDGRWWSDHRFPGGIAFTANSIGHMLRFRDWYESKEDNENWALKHAMLTIEHAAPTKATESSDPEEQGRATWLLPINTDGKPMIDAIKCPFAKTLPKLEGKDWTRYAGLLHTDHAIREEFFVDRDTAPTQSRPYLMDFTYLYAVNAPDFEDFTRGKCFTLDEVYAETGRPESWSYRSAETAHARSEAEAAVVAEQLYACSQWEMPPS